MAGSMFALKAGHQIYKHPDKQQNVVIAGHGRNEDIPLGI
jgi:predicted RNA binding protein YcfA (HicA-like mRNA interferase family)